MGGLILIKKSYCCGMRLFLLSMLLLGTLPALGAPTHAAPLPKPAKSARLDPASGVKTAIFRSRRALEKRLGRAFAEQLPPEFNFALFSLVWVDLPHTPDALLEIITLPAERSFSLADSPYLGLTLRRSRETLRVELVRDGFGPCSGGIQKPPETMLACHAEAERLLAKAKERLPLFATPRADLKSVKLEVKAAPPRPRQPQRVAPPLR